MCYYAYKKCIGKDLVFYEKSEFNEKVLIPVSCRVVGSFVDFLDSLTNKVYCLLYLLFPLGK